MLFEIPGGMDARLARMAWMRAIRAWQIMDMIASTWYRSFGSSIAQSLVVRAFVESVSSQKESHWVKRVSCILGIMAATLSLMQFYAVGLCFGNNLFLKNGPCLFCQRFPVIILALIVFAMSQDI